MMKLVLVAALCGVVCADIGLVARGEEQVPIIDQANEPSIDGNFNWRYESADGTSVNQQGTQVETGDPEYPQEQVLRGSYSYIGQDGKTYTIDYIADGKGFRPVGEHLPPPIVQNAEAAQGLPPLRDRN